MSRPSTVDEFLRYEFSKLELEELASKLARALVGIEEVESRRSTAMAEFKEQLETLHESAGKLAHQVRDRSEMRWQKCRILWHEPRDGEKTLVHGETGEVVRICAMSESERQEELPLPELTVEPVPGEMPLEIQGSEEPRADAQAD